MFYEKEINEYIKDKDSISMNDMLKELNPPKNLLDRVRDTFYEIATNTGLSNYIVNFDKDTYFGKEKNDLDKIVETNFTKHLDNTLSGTKQNAKLSDVTKSFLDKISVYTNGEPAKNFNPIKTIYEKLGIENDKTYSFKKDKEDNSYSLNNKNDIEITKVKKDFGIMAMIKNLNDYCKTVNKDITCDTKEIEDSKTKEKNIIFSVKDKFNKFETSTTDYEKDETLANRLRMLSILAVSILTNQDIAKKLQNENKSNDISVTEINAGEIVYAINFANMDNKTIFTLNKNDNFMTKIQDVIANISNDYTNVVKDVNNLLTEKTQDDIEKTSTGGVLEVQNDYDNDGIGNDVDDKPYEHKNMQKDVEITI